MLLRKCYELYHLVEEKHENPSDEIDKKILELKKEIDRIIASDYPDKILNQQK